MGAMADRLEANVRVLADTREFGAWMTSEQKRVFLLCRRMLDDTEEADSATQDTFLKAWQALKRPESKELDDPGKWLTRIAVNTCLDRLRSRRWHGFSRCHAFQDSSVSYSFAKEVPALLDRAPITRRPVFGLGVSWSSGACSTAKSQPRS